jgi:predicted protein tyrosine phosphatase
MPLSGDLIAWAVIILVMEVRQKNKVSKKYPSLLKDKRIVYLDILDHYGYMQPVLIEPLELSVPRYIRTTNYHHDHF